MNLLDPQILTAVFAAITAILSIFLTQAYARNQALRSELSKEKQRLYSAYVDFMHKFYSLTKHEENIQPDEVTRLSVEFEDYHPKLLTFASNDVVKSAGDFMQHLYRYDQKAIDSGDRSWHIISMQYFGDLMIAVRKDLGHNKKWNKMFWVDILRLTIRDTDDYVPKKYASDRYSHPGPSPIIDNNN